MVTWCSCIASSSAACTLAGARLISSARMIWAKSGPFLTWNSWVFWSKTMVPIRSAGSRSGVAIRLVRSCCSISSGDALVA